MQTDYVRLRQGILDWSWWLSNLNQSLCWTGTQARGNSRISLQVWTAGSSNSREAGNPFLGAADASAAAIRSKSCRLNEASCASVINDIGLDYTRSHHCIFFKKEEQLWAVFSHKLKCFILNPGQLHVSLCITVTSAVFIEFKDDKFTVVGGHNIPCI